MHPECFKLTPVDTVLKLNVHETFRRRPRRLLNVLCKFNLRPVVYTGILYFSQAWYIKKRLNYEASNLSWKVLESGKTYFKNLVNLNRVPPIFFSWWEKLENQLYLKIEDLLVLTPNKNRLFAGSLRNILFHSFENVTFKW